ncbi:hypothetical protein KKB28_04210, partial [bacterium]|nr:hypothetical protein [bacterium]
MKRSVVLCRGFIVLCFVLMCFYTHGFAQETIDPRYHTYDEIMADIFALQETYPTMVKVDSIGHSSGQTDGRILPIYAVKISDNVQVNEDEPAVLFIGHIHAEEILGIEIIHALLHELTDGYMENLPHVRYWVQQLQIYIVPSMNPDGLTVVMDGRDVSYRKNGYRPPPLTDCTITPGMGWDSCGVDVNRNFGLNWDWGDTLWQPGGNEPYDYYGGPAPFSEPEAQCIRDFAEEIQPVTSVVYHSSREGGNAEKCIFAWNWEGKEAPDSVMIAAFGTRFALEIPNFDHSSHYLFVLSGNHRGNTQDWFYWKLGTLQTANEVGSIETGIQPDSALIEQIIEDLLPGARFILDRTRHPDNTEHIVYGHVKDALTSEPLRAEWRIVSTWKRVLPPRYTEPIYGRYYFLPADSFTVEFRKEGYVTKREHFTRRSSREFRDVLLEPLPWHDVHIRIEDEGGQALPSIVYIKSTFSDTMMLPTGEINISKPTGNYEFFFVANDIEHVGYRKGYWIHQDTSLVITLPTGNVVLIQDFEDMAADWTFGGENSTWTTSASLVGQALTTNSIAFRTTYLNNANAWAEYSHSLDLSGANSAHLQFDRYSRMDPDDSLGVEISTDAGVTWESAGWFYDMDLPWTRAFLCLDRWAPASDVRLRFRLVSDSAFVELGVMIDNLYLIAGTNTSAPSPESNVPFEYKFESVYPNPFNPTAVLTYTVAAPGQIQIRITNVLGQRVATLTDTCPSAG